jgi:soluble lytic murein transglycosylase-like protein
MSGTPRKLSAALLAGSIAAIALIGCGGASASPPQQVADGITQNDAALREAIDAWRSSGDPPSGPPTADVVDRAADLQDQIAFLGDHPKVAGRVMPLLSGSVRAEVARLLAARRALLRLSAGSSHKQLKLGQRPPLADLVGFYAQAERRFGIGANYLAAIHLVETKFGRVVNNSVAGAQGPMQFIPSTWRIYGHGGNIRDPHDAILGAARLLRANGAPGRYGPALRAYNPSGLYVAAVTQYARLIGRDPYSLYYLYTWEP